MRYVRSSCAGLSRSLQSQQSKVYARGCAHVTPCLTSAHSWPACAAHALLGRIIHPRAPYTYMRELDVGWMLSDPV